MKKKRDFSTRIAPARRIVDMFAHLRVELTSDNLPNKLAEGYWTLIDYEDRDLVETRAWHFKQGKPGKTGTAYRLDDSHKRILHRLILARKEPSWDSKNLKNEVVHKNGNSLDNRRENLAPAVAVGSDHIHLYDEDGARERIEKLYGSAPVRWKMSKE